MEKQYSIFGTLDKIPEPGKKAGGRKYKTMQEMYGVKEGHTCKDCKHLTRNKWDKTYFKCELWHQSNSAATDIRLKNKACGEWEAGE